MRRIRPSRARRQRGRLRLRPRRPRSTRLARALEAPDARPAVRSALFDAACRHDPRRHGAQYPGARMRVPLGVSRPAGRVDDGPAALRSQAYIDEVALPRLRRFVADPKIETCVEVDVPGLDAEPGSPAETLACKLAAPTGRWRFPTRPKRGNSSAPACRRSSAARARSTRRTSPTSSSSFRRSTPASASCAAGGELAR